MVIEKNKKRIINKYINNHLYDSAMSLKLKKQLTQLVLEPVQARGYGFYFC